MNGPWWPQRMFQVVVRGGRFMALEDYVLSIAFGGAFVLGLMFIVMRREAQVNLQSGMTAEGLLQQHSGMGFGKAISFRLRTMQTAYAVSFSIIDSGATSHILMS